MATSKAKSEKEQNTGDPNAFELAIKRLNDDGNEIGTDYDVLKGRVKGKDFKIVVVAPDVVVWTQLQAAAEATSKGVQNAKIWDESQKCVVYPSLNELKDICDKKPAVKTLVTNTVGKLATAGLGFLRD